MYYLLEYNDKRFYVIYAPPETDGRKDVYGTVIALNDKKSMFKVGQKDFWFDKRCITILFKSEEEGEVLGRFYLELL